MVPKLLAKAIQRWPTGDLAELLLLVKTQLDQRAAHYAQGGGIQAAVAAGCVGAGAGRRKQLSRDASKDT